jgi:hypothetical protein
MRCRRFNCNSFDRWVNKMRVAEQMVEFGCHHIDREQDEYPDLDCKKGPDVTG